MRKTRILLCVTLLSITLGTGSCVILQDADLLAPIAALTPWCPITEPTRFSD